MAEDLSLLFRLRAQNESSPAIRAAQADVQKLNQTFGSQFPQMQQVATQALGSVTEKIHELGREIPGIGKVTEGLSTIFASFSSGPVSKFTEHARSLSSQIDSLAKSSGKTSGEVLQFVRSFATLETQTAKTDAAFKFFGGTLDTVGNKTAKFTPELESAAASLSAVTAASESVSVSLAAVAGPIGIAVLALIVEVAAVVELSAKLFELAKSTAEYQGKLADLSQQVGVSVELLSALEISARKTGGSIEAVTQSLGIFQQNLQQAAEHATSLSGENDKASDAFRKLGVNVSDTETTFRQTIAALAGMQEGFQQTALARDLFGGRGAKAVLAILKETNGDIDEVIRRTEHLGGVTTEQAKIADEFNDKLVDLDVELKGLATKAIPVVLDVLNALERTLVDNRDLFHILQGIVASFTISIAGPLRLALASLNAGLFLLKPQLQVTADIFQKIKEAIEFISGHPISLPGLSAGPAETPPTEKEPAIDPFLQQTKDEIDARKRLQGVLNFEFAERQKQAEASIALAQQEFDAGHRTRQQLLDETINGLRKETQAEIDKLENDRSIKLRSIALAEDNVAKQDQIKTELLAIDTQIASKRSDLARQEADARAKSQLDEQKADLAHEQAKLDILTKAGQQKIAVIEEQIKLEKVDRETALREIEAIENASLQARGQLLKRKLQLAGIGPDRQGVLDEIKALETDRTALERQQSERRKQITREEFESKRQILISGIDTLLQIEQISGQSQIATLEALAKLRVKTEEDAAKEILAIRLKLIDDQIEATGIKLAATRGIVDPKQRTQEQADLNNQLKILNAQRESIQQDGNRNIDEKRQEDLDNERRYADELRDIRERISDIERDAAEEVIRLMRLHLARREDILRAQRDLDIKEEDDRHRRATDSINEQKREVDAEIKVLETHLGLLKIGTIEEIEEHDRLIESLEKLRVKREELNRAQSAVDTASQTRKRRITDEADIGLEQANPLSTRSLFGDQFAENLARIREQAALTGESISALSANFQAAAASAAQFFEAQSEAAGNFATIAGGAIETFTDGLKQMISAWVLSGETGPAALRKLTAQVLAQVAAQAAVKAIFELAEGFALLFVNPAASASHFTAAAIYGSVAGAAAIAGRGVAGDLFKSKTGSTGEARQGSQSGQINPASLARNPGQAPAPVNITIHMNGEAAAAFDYKVTKIVRDNYSSGGVLRETFNNDGGVTG